MQHPTFNFVPGPSALYFTAEHHIQEAVRKGIPSISHRSEEFKNIYRHTDSQLRNLLNLPDNYQILFAASATEIWERIAQNLVLQKSGHVVNGAFSEKCLQTAKDYQLQTEEVRAAWGEVQLAQPGGFSDDVEVIHFTLNETSTGAQYPVENIYEIRKAYPEALISVDMVSAAPVLPIDFEQIDCAYFSVQKCFGLPAGLGVWLINDRCLDKFRKNKESGRLTGSYRRLDRIADSARKFQTQETPNVLNIYLLGKIAEDMNQRGIQAIRNDGIYKSVLLYETFRKHPALKPLVLEEKFRSGTVAYAQCEGGAKRFVEALAQKGLCIGTGYGKLKEDCFRIANFPTHSRELIEMLCDELLKIE